VVEILRSDPKVEDWNVLHQSEHQMLRNISKLKVIGKKLFTLSVKSINPRSLKQEIVTHALSKLRLPNLQLLNLKVSPKGFYFPHLLSRWRFPERGSRENPLPASSSVIGEGRFFIIPRTGLSVSPDRLPIPLFLEKRINWVVAEREPLTHFLKMRRILLLPNFRVAARKGILKGSPPGSHLRGQEGGEGSP
jgi:hypothetical protein